MGREVGRGDVRRRLLVLPLSPLRRSFSRQRVEERDRPPEMPPLDESMVMVAFDEEAERYYQEAPPEYLLDLPMQDERHKPEEVAANLAVYESSLLPDPLPVRQPSCLLAAPSLADVALPSDHGMGPSVGTDDCACRRTIPSGSTSVIRRLSLPWMNSSSRHD